MGEVGERSQNNLDCSVHMMPRTGCRAAWSGHCHPWHIPHPLLASAHPEKPGQAKGGLHRFSSESFEFQSEKCQVRCSSQGNHHPLVRADLCPSPGWSCQHRAGMHRDRGTEWGHLSHIPTACPHCRPTPQPVPPWPGGRKAENMEKTELTPRV